MKVLAHSKRLDTDNEMHVHLGAVYAARQECLPFDTLYSCSKYLLSRGTFCLGTLKQR